VPSATVLPGGDPVRRQQVMERAGAEIDAVIAWAGGCSWLRLDRPADLGRLWAVLSAIVVTLLPATLLWVF
jgi:hypothetical protein